MEKAKDQKQIWRKYVNHQLKSKYKFILTIELFNLFKSKKFYFVTKMEIKTRA